MLLPNQLQIGDEIRVIAPSRSAYILDDSVIQIATERLTKIGFRVTFSKHWAEKPLSGGLESTVVKLDDLHEAFRDKNVKAIFTAIGGFNSNLLLDDIDFDLIANNPKIFCGFSDITVLANAIYQKTGLITYLGPHFSSWGMLEGFEYSEQSFGAVLMRHETESLESSHEWSSDEWYLDQMHRKFTANSDAHIVITPGDTHGRLVGGNISSFMNLLGTPYLPSLEDAILLLEQSEDNPRADLFSAQLAAISMQPGFSELKGMLIGRFPESSDMNMTKLKQIIRSNARLNGLPIIANVNFGHTTPISYFPIGARCAIRSYKQVMILVYPS